MEVAVVDALAEDEAETRRRQAQIEPHDTKAPSEQVEFYDSNERFGWQLLARLGSPAARNRSLLYPQERTFPWPSLTSGFDPTRTFEGRSESQLGPKIRVLDTPQRSPERDFSLPSRGLFLRSAGRVTSG